MILTITPNPSIDLLFAAERLVWDDANRLAQPRRRAGGQGINLARAVRALGGDAVAVAPLGGAAGEELSAMLRDEGTPLEPVRIAGETRLFVGVREAATRRNLLLNPRGPALGADDAARLLEAVAAAIRKYRPGWIVCCGSLPPGLPDDLYARAGGMARDAGIAFVADCDGPPLRLAAASRCDVLAPNAHEAERLLEMEPGSVDGPEAAAAAARAMMQRFAARFAFVTLGSAGAVAADMRDAWHAAAADAPADGSAVGAGDAFLGAALLALDAGRTTSEALRSGVAAGTAVLGSTAGTLLTPDGYEEAMNTTSARRIG